MSAREGTTVYAMTRTPESAWDDVGGPPEADRPDLSRLAGAELRGAFGRLFDEHAAALHRYLARRVGPSVAEDIVAETFLAALRGRHGYDPARAGVRAWLYGIATNLLRHHVRAEVRALRATARLAYQAGVGEDHAEAVSARVDAEHRVGQLAAALAELSPGDREVLLLTSWAGLTAGEVGEALDIPAGTVRSRLHRVRRWVRGHAPTTEENR
jgi:RNA polymerase sigma-70 factor (ECF subfamily)